MVKKMTKSWCTKERINGGWVVRIWMIGIDAFKHDVLNVSHIGKDIFTMDSSI